VSAEPTTSLAARRGQLSRLAAYSRLGKLHIVEHWLPAVLAWSLVESGGGTSAAAVATVALFAIGVIGIASAGAAFDDVQGLQDGIDQRTYGRGQAERTAVNKPLISGALTERQGVRFAWLATIAGLTCSIGSIALAPHRPLWLLGAFLVVALSAVQYSWGLKLSYHGLGELVLAAGNAIAFVVPFVFVTGGLSGAAALHVALLMTWMTQVTAYSGAADADIDIENDRLTLMARLRPAGRLRLIAALLAASIALVVGGVLLGLLSPAALVALLPAWALQIRQVGLGRRGEWLRARSLGWRAYDLAVVALIAIHLLAG